MKIILAIFLLATILGCFDGEECAQLWPPFTSSICDGGQRIVQFCINPEEPNNRSYFHYHTYCISSTNLNPITFIPLVVR